MLSQAELQARIAAEFLRVGASQQSWDQNFPSQPSTWTQTPAMAYPILTDESREVYEGIAGEFLDQDRSGTGGLRDPDPEPNIGVGRICIAPAVAQYISGSWVCVYPDGALQGSLPDDEDEFGDISYPLGPGQGTGTATSPTATPTATSGSTLPRFVGGKLGKVLFTPIANRQLAGIRTGILPQVVMGDYAPASYAAPGLDAGGSNIGGGGNDLIQP